MNALHGAWLPRGLGGAPTAVRRTRRQNALVLAPWRHFGKVRNGECEACPTLSPDTRGASVQPCRERLRFFEVLPCVFRRPSRTSTLQLFFRKEKTLYTCFLAVRNTLRLTNNNGIIFQEALKGSLARRQDQGYANHRAAAQPRAPVSRGPAAPRSEVAQRLWRWPTRAAARFQWRGENQDECSALCQLRAGRRAGPPAGARIPVGSRRRRATAAPVDRAAQPFGGTSEASRSGVPFGAPLSRRGVACEALIAAGQCGVTPA